MLKFYKFLAKKRNIMQILNKYKKSFLLSLAALLIILLISFLISKNTVKRATASVLDSYSNYERIEILPSASNDFFILVTTNEKSYVCIFNSKQNICIQAKALDYKYTASSNFENQLSLVEYDVNKGTKIHVYSLLNNVLNLDRTEILPQNTKISGEGSFCFLNDTFFYINENDRSSVVRYKPNEINSKENNFLLENDLFSSIAINNTKDKMLVMTVSNKCFVLEIFDTHIKNCKEISNRLNSFCKFLRDDIFVSKDNTIYKFLDDDDLIKIFNFENKENSKEIITIFSDKNTGKNYILISYDSHNINCLEILSQDGDTKVNLNKKITFENSNILSLGYNSNNNETIVMLKNGEGIEIKLINSEDLIDISSIAEQSDEDIVENDSYILNLKNKRIIIKNDTISTVREFKEIFEEGGHKIGSFKNYLGKDISGSEKIGTGSTVKFLSDKEILEYKIIVLSDITGEGNANSKDRSTLLNYLLGKIELTEDVLKAADINIDGDVDAIDLLALDKILNEKVKSDN